MQTFRTKSLALVIAIAVLAVGALPALAAPPPPPPTLTFTATLLDPLPTDLVVGESYTVRILVESDQPFVLALVLNAPDFPAYLATHGGSTALNTNSAVLQMTFIGRRSTASLPGGVTPSVLSVAGRFQGGAVILHQFPFDVAVH